MTYSALLHLDVANEIHMCKGGWEVHREQTGGWTQRLNPPQLPPSPDWARALPGILCLQSSRGGCAFLNFIYSGKKLGHPSPVGEI